MEQTRYFQYNIENVTVAPATSGSWTVKVIFSVTNPVAMDVWDIKTAAPFQSAGANLTLDVGWDSKEFTNTGSAGAALVPIATTALGAGAAIPVQVRGLQTAAGATLCASASDCPGATSLVNRYWIARTVTPVPAGAVTAGRVALEGRPVCSGLPGCPTTTAPFANVPVKSATADFVFTASTSALVSNQRRQIVDISKCQRCHDDQQHGDTVVPRLSLHGANRNENLNLCVACHNPNQTDVPYRFLSPLDARIGGPETPIDFKVMVHSIHAGGFRKSRFVVIGFNSSVNDFSGVRFPSKLRNCVNCHLDVNGKGTFELPLKSNVLGTTVKTQSIYQVAAGALRTTDVDPSNDQKISPTAAVCSSCHDSAEVRSHMIRTGGASFATTQAAIGTTVVERCANCHGPGKRKDVRRAHEIGGASND